MTAKIFDLIIIGGGPSGLAAAINASSEGLDTVLVDCHDHLGGQASASTRVENYPGFPDGISGADLMALFIQQADKFDTKVVAPVQAQGLSRDAEGLITVTTNDPAHRRIVGRAVVLALGLKYNRLSAKGVSTFLGRGVHYGVMPTTLQEKGKRVVVVGGANSASQAALHLANLGCTVTMVVREENLGSGTSQYLVQRIADHENITVHGGHEITRVLGDTKMRSVAIRRVGKEDGPATEVEADGLLIYIGAAPKSYWLKDIIAMTDGKGFLLTGAAVAANHAGRAPLPYETSMPGVFACGDVREGSIKRIGSGVGEGVVVVQQVKQYLELMKAK